MNDATKTDPLKLLILGGVAGGATAAARARRVNEDAEITIVERGPYVSYANCGLPYFISGDIAERSSLLLETPQGFARRYRVDALVNTDALEIDRTAKRVRVQDANGTRWLEYDRLILAQGGTPIRPTFPGSDAPHVFTLWTVPDTDRMDAYMRDRAPKSAVVVGGGFIGLEMAEAFVKRGIATTIVELMPTVMSLMDREFGVQVANECAVHGASVITGVAVTAVHADDHTVELSDGRRIAADLVLFSVGVRPELTLAKSAGLEIGASGGLHVNPQLQTSDPNIYAAGDMVEVEHTVSGKRVRVPLAGPANRQGRIAASNALGVPMDYHGAAGTSVVKVFEATAALTGLTEKGARDAGFDVGAAVVHTGNHAGYYPGARQLSLKLVYDRRDARLLGAQAFGHEGVEKRIDVLSTALHGRMTLHDVAELDLAYAPPYSSANDPVNMAAFVGLNDVSGFSSLITATELKRELASAEPPFVIDVRDLQEYEEGHLEGVTHIPLFELRGRMGSIPRDRAIVVHCRVGKRGHVGARILRGAGFERVRNLTGGWTSALLEGGFRTV